MPADKPDKPKRAAPEWGPHMPNPPKDSMWHPDHPDNPKNKNKPPG